MDILVVLAHPDPESLNAAIAAAAAEAMAGLGHRVTLRDLYRDGFDPLLPAPEIPEGADLPGEVAACCAELAAAEGLVLVHPNWWGMPPAVMTGYIDRVFRPGVAYRFLEGDGGEGVPAGLLKARAAVVFNTANTPEERERRAFGDPLERIWRDCVLGLCGVAEFHRRTFGVVCTSTPEERRAWLEQARALVTRVFPPEQAP